MILLKRVKICKHRLADNSRPVSFTVRACYKIFSSAERNRQTERGKNTQCTNNSDHTTSTSELLLRQNSITAHAHQS
jgi:hypothetical protein